jgi:two-component sensor histidine kinase
MSTPAPRKKRSSILRRIMLLSWLVAVMSVGTFAGLAFYHLHRGKRDDLDQRSRELAGVVGQRVGQQLSSRLFSPVVKECLALLPEEEGLRFIVIRPHSGPALVHYLAGGEVRWSDDPAVAGRLNETPPGVNDAFQITAEAAAEKIWHHSQALSYGTESVSVGTVELGFSMREYDDSLGVLYRNLLTSGAIVLVVGVAISYSVARNLIRPLRALQQFAQRVTGGVPSARMELEKLQTTGEIADLADSINVMVASLEQSSTKIRESMKNSASLREKEILLREIHHRVKNNMQILTSLLRLQTRQADSEKMRQVLMESEARIRSMGLLHEKLYKSESVSTINMHGYLRTLTGELTRMNTPEGCKREIKLNVHGVDLGLDTALPCGLIITELVTNALKYAFGGRKDGIIYVSLGTTGNGHHQLVVWDNGKGMDPDFDISKATSLGMRLVRMLTDQLHGTLKLEASQGTRVTITFRETQYETRL